MAKRKPTAIAQLKLRLRESLRAQLEASAKKNNLSLNQEIVSRLAESFEVKRIGDLHARHDALDREVAEIKAHIFKEFPDLEKKK